MINLTKSLNAWGSSDFKDTLKHEIEQLDANCLPLQQGLSCGSYAIDTNLKAMVLGISDLENLIQVKVGIFYSSTIPGCSCADDPTPIDENSEYCEFHFEIDKSTAATKVYLFQSDNED